MTHRGQIHCPNCGYQSMLIYPEFHRVIFFSCPECKKNSAIVAVGPANPEKGEVGR